MRGETAWVARCVRRVAAGLTVLALALGCSPRTGGVGHQASGSSAGALLTVAAGAQNPAGGTVSPGATGVVSLQFDILGNLAIDATLTEVAITAYGTADDATAVSAVTLYRDTNANGVPDAADPALGSAQGFPADDGTVTLAGLAVSIPAGSTFTGLVTVSLAANAVAGTTFGVEIAANTDLAGLETATGRPVRFQGAPVQGPLYGIGAGTARVVAIQPDSFAGRDTFIKGYGLYQNDNYGVSPTMAVGDRDSQAGSSRAFVEFPLDGISGGATIDRAELQLYYYGTEFHNELVTIRVHRVVDSVINGVAVTPWIEGASGFDLNLDGMAWDGDMAGGMWPYQDSDMPRYTQPNVDATTDYGHGPNGILDEVVVDQTTGRWITFDVTGAVRAWVQSGQPNHGLRLMGANEGYPFTEGVKHFYTSDYAVDPTLRPKLVVTVR